MGSKMFYTAEEAASKLGKTVEQVLDMGKRGEIQEFRDREKVMFKAEQINLLCGEDEGGDIPLALEDSSHGSAIDLADSGKPIARTPQAKANAKTMADSSEETGISAFEASRFGQDKKSGSGELSLETVGSGSGLLDLTRENDDSLSGAALIEDAFSNDENVELPANASGLFDAAGGADSGGNVVAAGAGTMTMMPMMVEDYDGAWSGAGIGLMIGSVIALACVLIMAVVNATGSVPAIATMFTENMPVWGGGLALVAIICGVAGFAIGRWSE
jgi:hypothetical protein